MSAPWMPLYVADYLADTGHLTTLEHGAYMLLIMTYWRRGGLPDDDAQLARIVRLTMDEWLNIRSTIVQLFFDGWKHRRIDAELERSAEKAKQASEAGKRSAKARFAQRPLRASSTNAPTDEQLSQSHSQEPSSEGSAPAPVRKPSRSTRLAPTAEMTEADIATAAEYGLNNSAASAEWKIFRAYQLDHDTMSFNWPQTWRRWVARKPQFSSKTGPPPLTPIAEPEGFYAKLDTAEWNAWNTYKRDTTGKAAQTDRNGGWRFPTRWPPGHSAAA